jgi:DNA-binding XRE family transcriptional regulator
VSMPTSSIPPTMPERAVRVAAPDAPTPSKPVQRVAGAVRAATVRAAPSPAAAPHVVTSPVATREGERPLTGADLARWRTTRGITQRAAAEELGVAPSTVAKAELVPSKPLGEQLQVSMRTAKAR